jgi:hypothetical protein
MFSTLLLILISWAAATNTHHHIPTHKDDHGVNLPIHGSSLFDKIFSRPDESNQVVYDVPYPLEKLLEKVIRLDKSTDAGAFVHSLLPFSRSLQRPRDLSYNPLWNPRIVFTPGISKSSPASQRLFLGFVEAKDQIEVISYNDEAGRFEFQIISDYSTNPKVAYVDRGKCLTCHQNQAPIFSPPSWQDTSFGIMGQLVTQNLGLDGNSPTNRHIAMERLFGPLASRDSAAEFDMAVRFASQLAFDERAWRFGCGSSDPCRLGLLLRTLSPNSQWTSHYSAIAEQTIANSDLMHDETYSSFIRSTQLGVPQALNKYKSFANIVQSEEALLDIIGSLYNLSPRDNPATPRPTRLASKSLNSPLTSFPPVDRTLIKQEIPDDNWVASLLIQQLDAPPPNIFSGSINKNHVMWMLLNSVGSPHAKQFEPWLNPPTPKKSLLQTSLPPVFQQTELNLLSRYCAQCHGIQLQFPPQFLLGTEAEVIEKITLLKEKMIRRIKVNQMPPSIDEQEIFQSSGDRSLVLEYLDSL